MPSFAPLSPIFSLPIQGTVIIQAFSLETSVFFGSILPLTLLLSAPKNLIVSGLDTYSCPQTVHFLFSYPPPYTGAVLLETNIGYPYFSD